MYILGINAYHGDSSASIFKDGQFIAAIEEERIRRCKHWAGFPAEAIRFCLHEAGISLEELDYVAVSRDPKANVYRKLWHVIRHRVKWSAIRNRVANAKKVSSIRSELLEALGESPGALNAEIHDIEHHRSHLASAFFASPFNKAAILSIDGFGDFSSTMLGVGEGNQLEVLDSVIYPHSIGIFYTAFTQYLGFPHYGDEYKVMGLAPYGKPLMVDALKDVLQLTADGLFQLKGEYFRHFREGVSMSWEGGQPAIGALYSNALVECFGPAREVTEELTQRDKDLAASVQRVCEEAIFHLAVGLHERTGCEDLCVAGGVAQNSVANGKMIANTPFKRLYVPSAGHDAGTAMGASLYLYNQVLRNPRIEPLRHAYWGSCFNEDYIRYFLDTKAIAYRRFEDYDKLNEHVASRLAEGGVVGWFQGRSEFGPRALGHRSILVDPSRADAKELLNSKIKRRESFRPFAPSILKECVGEYFETVDDVPFMEKVFVIRPEKRGVIPAVTHVDGTGRLQTVDAGESPKYHALIRCFGKKTGVPILLNTSFNENEPIVDKPEEAYACFARTKMDMLVLENFVVER